MRDPLVSIVVPAYMQAEFLSATVGSVLGQTYRNLELIVVDDASPDNTSEVMSAFSDPRIRHIVHESNQGLSAARNTGIRASRGEIIALLDADDLFHPDKLAAHVDFLGKHSEIGVAYNARFDLNHSAETIRDKWQPPLEVGLSELLLWFPFSPSDMVARRKWLFRAGLFDPAVRTAEDTDLPCRLALMGCRFGGLAQALNYRRYHSGRPRRNLAGRLEDVRRVQAAVFADPRCPEHVRALGARALKHHLIDVTALALVQRETELAQTFLRKLVQLDPSVVVGRPCELMDHLLRAATLDDSLDHARLLRSMLDQMPPELSHLSDECDRLAAHGFLLKGVRTLIWDKAETARAYLKEAGKRQAPIDKRFAEAVCHSLLLYRGEYGDHATQEVISELRLTWKWAALKGRGRLEGTYFINRAFELYHSGKRRGVPTQVLRAFRGDPGLTLNRGAVSILFRSLLRPAAI